MPSTSGSVLAVTFDYESNGFSNAATVELYDTTSGEPGTLILILSKRGGGAADALRVKSVCRVDCYGSLVRRKIGVVAWLLLYRNDKRTL